MERMQSPLGRVRGLGSARDGAREWWMNRVLSVALVPLILWWVISVIAHLHSDYGTFVAWLGSPINAVLMIVTIFATFYHIALGIQVVLEDYVHHEWAKLAALLATKFACVLLGVAGVFAVLRIAFEG